MQISCKSDIGRMRSQNQDSVFASDKPVGKLPNLLIVADGMGGHKAGDFASRYAVEKLVECISESVYENPLLIVSDAIRVVNRRIYEKSQDYEEYRGMGTTLTLAFVDEASKLHVFQVGDSRLYLISDTIPPDHKRSFLCGGNVSQRFDHKRFGGVPEQEKYNYESTWFS